MKMMMVLMQRAVLQTEAVSRESDKDDDKACKSIMVAAE